MDQTFMTIHDLGADANILFASDSITEILGYQPHEVLDKSSFDYFHPDEVPFARSIHSRGVLLDKAAVLHYARLRSRNGQWVSCECCFTIVHDVLVACISVYQQGEKSQRRAVEAPQIRRLFSCSPKDPRYHMLQHLSPKFELPPAHREPRAALILNRFTRSLSIMFSTNAIASILGLAPEDIHNKSFYECIQESCLEDAVRCLESAKANDSIAYLRFWSRDPRRAEEVEEMEESEDEEPELDGLQQDGAVDGQSIKEEPDVDGLTDGVGPSQHRSHDSLLSDSDSGGVPLDDEMDLDSNGRPSPRVKLEDGLDGLGGISQEAGHFSTQDGVQESSSSANSMQDGVPIADGIRSQRARYSRARGGRRHPRYPLPSIELEAVVSCTSDGLVVILRKARPPIPTVNPSPMSSTPRQGIFAAPWGQQPIRPQYPAEAYHTFQAPLMPQTMPVRAGVAESGGPPLDYLMESIREVAVFAWAVVGINGNLASYGRGRPLAGAQPSAGLPIWDPSAGPTSYQGPENEAVSRWAAFESGRMPWPNRGGQSIGSTPGANGTGRMMKSNGNTRFTSNGYNNHNPRGQDNFAPNGGRNFLSNGHNTHMPNGHAQNGHNGHNGHNVNGHNGYTPNGPSNYTVGSNMWSQPSQQTDGSSTNGHEQRDVRNGRNNAQPNGHNWNGMPTEIGWNLFSHAQHDGITDGNSTTRNSSGSHPRRWPQ